jgi:zinc protease
MGSRSRASTVANGAALVLALVLSAPLAAAPGSTGPATRRTLDNGLEVFVVENHAVPLATICVAFRAGAYAQTPETAGIFHLYEHMLFNANEKYPNQAAFKAAMNRMGVSNWNGATGLESIYYYITLPSDRLEEGIEFWSWAVEKPIFGEADLEREKDVVLSEIRGYHSDPNHIMADAIESRMFPGAPWRKNIDGPEENIKKATAAGLEEMRKGYYIPANAALMIGGDVDPERVWALAATWFGAWKGGEKPKAGEPPQGPIPPGIALAYPDETFYQGVAQVQFRWRGPDVLRQTKDSFTTDVLLYLLSSPVGRFKTALMEKGPGLYDPEYIDFNYLTARDGGTLDFSTFLVVQDPAGEEPILERTEKLRAALNEEFALIAKEPESYFGAGELAKAKTKLIDQNLLSMEVASSFVTSVLRFWWSVATTDYFFGYEESCGKVSYADIADLIGRYIIGAPSAAGMRVESETFAADPGMDELLRSMGYSIVTADNAFWWQR